MRRLCSFVGRARESSQSGHPVAEVCGVERKSSVGTTGIVQKRTERLFKGDFRQAALMGITLPPAVDREGCFFDCGIKRRLVSKPVDLGLGFWPDLANVSPDNSFQFHVLSEGRIS